jgi:ABC-2 type transport system permease protein
MACFFPGPHAHRIERYIVNGELDGLLLRPMNTLAMLILSKIDDDGLGDFIVGILVLIYASNKLSIAWSIQNMMLLVSTISGSVLIVFSLMLLLTSVGFWVIRSSVLSELIYPFMRFIEFPLEIYNPFIVFILTFVLPLGFVNYYPAQLFLGKGGMAYVSYLTPLIGIAFFVVAYAAWKFGLKNYASTGS